jgi:hypothetical protein
VRVCVRACVRMCVQLLGMHERETVVGLLFAAGSCPCVEKLRPVLPFTVGIRDVTGAIGVHLGLRRHLSTRRAR